MLKIKKNSFKKSGGYNLNGNTEKVERYSNFKSLHNLKSSNYLKSSDSLNNYYLEKMKRVDIVE